MPLSAIDNKRLAIGWLCFESEPKIDYAKFADLAGLASPHSARELVRVTKKKLREEYGTADSITTTTAAPTPRKADRVTKRNATCTTGTTTPASGGGTGRKRGRKATAEMSALCSSDDEEMVDVGTPSKKKIRAQTNSGESEGAGDGCAGGVAGVRLDEVAEE